MRARAQGRARTEQFPGDNEAEVNDASEEDFIDDGSDKDDEDSGSYQGTASDSSDDNNDHAQDESPKAKRKKKKKFNLWKKLQELEDAEITDYETDEENPRPLSPLAPELQKAESHMFKTLVAELRPMTTDPENLTDREVLDEFVLMETAEAPDGDGECACGKEGLRLVHLVNIIFA